MRYRFSEDNVEDLNSGAENADDQRSRPRTGTIEKIADITYDALRKHEIDPGAQNGEATSSR